MMWGFELAVIAAMLVFNAVFASYEMALASITRARIAVLLAERRKGAGATAFMKDRLEAGLAVVQLGITLAGAVAAATGGAGVKETLMPYLEAALGISGRVSEVLSLICLVLPLSALTVVFAELVPKVFALENKEWVCLRFSPAMRALFYVFYPVIVVFEWTVKVISRAATLRVRRGGPQTAQGIHELMAAASLARSSRLIGAREEKIVLSAAQLSVRPVSAAAVPVGEMSMIPAASTLTEALIFAHREMHTRFPVCETPGDPRTILGYVNFKDIVSALKINPGDPSIRGIVRPIARFGEETVLSVVLERMMQEKNHIALVAAANGEVNGLITFEDIIEELVGEIEDEYDRLPTYVHSYSAGVIAGGGAAMETVLARLGKTADSQVLGGASNLHAWCVRELGRAPQGGDTVERGGVRVLVRKTRRNKIAEALVS